ncbi:MAG: N-6 DNA methylase [Chloroflexi bacterium]|nr:N-6 DNA methylase [Chloroflexota bacterium]
MLVEQGKLLDFVDRVTQRPETPEEYVRQEIAKSLVREYGYSRWQISVEQPIRLGSRRPRVDLAVYSNAESREQGDIRLIIECKAPSVVPASRRHGVEQLKSYMAACPNAEFGMWTNGADRVCFRRFERDGELVFDEVLDIPASGETSDAAEQPTVAQLIPAGSDALLFAFRRCHNYITGNQGLQKPEAFWELLKLIFCKIQDERGSERLQFYAAASERHGINGPLKVKQRVGRLFAEVRAEYDTIFASNDEIALDPSVLAFLVAQLQMYSLLESDVDVKGRAYEEIVGANLRGDRGEFFTPRNVCNMCVDMLRPTETDTILDPACGTGGFLITAMNHVYEEMKRSEARRGGTQARREVALRQRVQRFASRSIFGIDLNPNLVKSSKMNMVMNNDGSGGLFQGNSLARPAMWSEELRDENSLDRVDILFTNPPFGSKIPIDDPSILSQFDLGHAWRYEEQTDSWYMTDRLQKSQPPEILFIERCVQFLTPGTGRMAIVLPDGILGSPGLGYVREWILTNTRVLASIDLHTDTFQPHVSVQTSVLVLERKDSATIARETASGVRSAYEVFLAVVERIGHDKRGNITYVRDDEGNEIVEEIAESDLRIEFGDPTPAESHVQRKRIDDDTPEVARAFREWLTDRGL